jgi:hypothetical protein
MTQPQKNKKTIEDQLADFTDRILAEEKVKQDEATFAPDPDLRALEQTSLRLKDAFDNGSPDEEVIQRMHRNITKQWRQQQEEMKQPIWQKLIGSFKAPEQKWRSQHSRQRFSMALSLATLVVLLLVAVPFLNDLGPNQPGASGQNLNIFVLVAIGGLILLALWLFRRKP